jgi:hypothetical protein
LYAIIIAQVYNHHPRFLNWLTCHHILLYDRYCIPAPDTRGANGCSSTAARNAQEKTALQRQIEATDRQIDQLVYQLYELTEAEIAIVEAASKR